MGGNSLDHQNRGDAVFPGLWPSGSKPSTGLAKHAWLARSCDEVKRERAAGGTTVRQCDSEGNDVTCASLREPFDWPSGINAWGGRMEGERGKEGGGCAEADFSRDRKSNKQSLN
ncbi:hypothetical protein CEXT_85371 [Caerostris extrusa]|uniref:Uncharacterized protein n=1 Tax=Caerostris extrusa TaxID=172846 RepID=A0AAV4QT16_CAEEX|nr:hypothetical protein CEXT_85371 [Caerostris extrusa]